MKSTPPPSGKGITAKAVLLGVLLIPINAYWIMTTEIVWYSGHPTVVSLFFNIVFVLLVLSLLNLGLRQVAPQLALRDDELIVVYTMLGIASAIASHDMMEILVPEIGHAFWFASPENDWANLILPYLPRWLTVSDLDVLQGYYLGESSAYSWRVLRAWSVPMVAWSGFIAVLVFVMLCFNTIIRRQWTEKEKLAYPIIQLPVSLASDTKAFFSRKEVWIGLALGLLLEGYNGLNKIFPALPMIPYNRRNIGRLLFTEKPWNAMSGMTVAFYPYIIGLGFFIPLDLSFSCWFFYLTWQLQRVLASALGLRNLPGFPYINEQSAGGYLALGLLALWVSRRHLSDVARHLVRGNVFPDEDREPLRYRTAVVGLVLGTVALWVFCLYMGISLWVAVLFFALYALLVIAVTRMRAELGTPVHDLHYSGPEQMLLMTFGSRALGPQNLTGLSLFWFLTRAFRGHPMPHQLEGFKMAERVRLNNRHLGIAMILAVVFGSFAAFWAFLDLAYRYGAASKIVGPALWFGRETYTRLESWLLVVREPDPARIVFHLIGGTITLLLAAMRSRFVWWPLHPAGYAVSSSWGMGVFWSCLFVSWLVKWTTLRFFGLRAHTRVGWFFMGVILGEGSARSIYGLASVFTGLDLGTGHW
ncbi:MAG: hypothetical protein KatS3mg115_0159 [Candidatus Poribacteria bacterium]|nr:MAG: hypothetical protein KatS3mg115_0159 [Candidatus Poribacteria bacterium]